MGMYECTQPSSLPPFSLLPPLPPAPFLSIGTNILLFWVFSVLLGTKELTVTL